jgi:hypothetical protein
MPNHECTPECIAELEGLAEEAASRANEMARTLHRERAELSALRSRVEELEAALREGAKTADGIAYSLRDEIHPGDAQRIVSLSSDLLRAALSPSPPEE